MLTGMMVMLSMQGVHYPLTYINPSGTIIVAVSDEKEVQVGKGFNPRLNEDTTKVVFWTPQTKDKPGTIQEHDLKEDATKTLVTGNLRHPSYSNSGQIAFASFHEDHWQLRLYDAQTIESTVLDDRDGVAPEWFPNGDTVLWTTLLDYAQVNLDGEENWKRRKPLPEGSPFTWKDRVVPHPLETDTYLISYTEWTPNGFLPVFGIQSLEEPLVRISPPDLVATQALWTRDGLSILFTGQEEEEAPKYVYKINRDGTGFQRLFEGHSPSM